MKTAILIPCYNAGHTVIGTAKHAAQFGSVVVIDDGSTDPTTRAALDQLESPVTVIRHERNRGKGAALRTGFEWILQNTFDAVITLDADGQHDPDEIPRFIEAYETTKATMILGNRELHHAEQPFIRRIGHLLTRGGLRIATGHTIPDSQCGYRLYSRSVLPELLQYIHAARYDWEMDALLYVLRKKQPITSIPIRTIYSPHAKQHSHFNYFRDTGRITASIVRYLIH